MMHNYYGNYSTDFFITLLFWVLVIYLIVNIVRWLKHTSIHGSDWHHTWRERRDYRNHYKDNYNDYERTGNYMKDQTPLDILKDRYARGEITKMQFEEMRRDIM